MESEYEKVSNTTNVADRCPECLTIEFKISLKASNEFWMFK